MQCKWLDSFLYITFVNIYSSAARIQHEQHERKKNGNKISDDHVLVVDTHRLYTHRKYIYIEKFFRSEVIKMGDSSNEIL